MSLVDIVQDAARTCASKPGRTMGLGLAVALGVATFVGVLSMSEAADAQVEERIAAVRPELVTLRPTGGEPGGPIPTGFGEDALERIGGEPSLEHAAVVDTYHLNNQVRARWGMDDEQVYDAPVMGVEGELIEATRATLDGASFDGTGSDMRVALVGRGLADRIGLSDPAAQPAIWVDGLPFTVLGVVTDSEYLAETTDAVIVPRRTATAMFSGQGGMSSAGYVRVNRGMADAAANTLPLRLTPQAPERWTAEVPRVPLDIAEGISSDLRNLSLAMAGLVMFIGIVAIANSMMRSVYERMPEIGLRRSLGARASQILGLLITESAQIGILAGILGVAVGLLAAVTVATRNDWPIVVSVWAAATALPASMIAGALGGLLPALTAVRVTPSQALRRE